MYLSICNHQQLDHHQVMCYTDHLIATHSSSLGNPSEISFKEETPLVSFISTCFLAWFSDLIAGKFGLIIIYLPSSLVECIMSGGPAPAKQIYDIIYHFHFSTSFLDRGKDPQTLERQCKIRHEVVQQLGLSYSLFTFSLMFLTCYDLRLTIFINWSLLSRSCTIYCFDQRRNILNGNVTGEFGWVMLISSEKSLCEAPLQIKDIFYIINKSLVAFCRAAHNECTSKEPVCLYF